MVCKRWSILLPSVSSVWPSRQLCFPTLPIPKVECSFVIAKMAFCSEILCRFSFLCVYNYLVKWFLWPLHATQQEPLTRQSTTPTFDQIRTDYSLVPTFSGPRGSLREGCQGQKLPKSRHCRNGGSDPCLDFFEGFVHMH